MYIGVVVGDICLRHKGGQKNCNIWFLYLQTFIYSFILYIVEWYFNHLVVMYENKYTEQTNSN